jgi:hypothetical protein
MDVMRKLDFKTTISATLVCGLAIALSAGTFTATALAQDDKAGSKPSQQTDQAKDAQASDSAAKDAAGGQAYSGMYTFLKEGEFVQLTVEDNGHVTGFISRFGEGESDNGTFLDQFFKNAKLDGNKLSFTTEIVHGVAFDFKGTVARGEGKNPGDEAYYVLQGTLVENTSDVNKKVTSHSRDVAFKIFPEEASSDSAEKK